MVQPTRFQTAIRSSGVARPRPAAASSSRVASALRSPGSGGTSSSKYKITTVGPRSTAPSTPAAPRGLLRQVTDAVTNIPAGVSGLVKEAANTVTGGVRGVTDLGKFALGQRDGNPFVDIFGDGVQLNDVASFTREYAPLTASVSTSMLNTGRRVTSPTQYLTAIREGNIVDTLLEDAGNVALVAGPLGKALGTTGSVVGASSETARLAAARAAGREASRGPRTTGTLGGQSRSLSASTAVPARTSPAQVRMPDTMTVKVPGAESRVLDLTKPAPVMSDLLPGGAEVVRVPGTGLAGRLERAANPSMAWNVEPSLGAQRAASAGARVNRLGMAAQWTDPADAILTVGARLGSRAARRVRMGPFMDRINATTQPVGPGQLEQATGRATSRIQRARTYLRNVRGGAQGTDSILAASTEGTRAGVNPAKFVNESMRRAGFAPDQIELYGNTALAATDRLLDTHLRGVQAMRNNPVFTAADIDGVLARLNADRPSSTRITLAHLDALADYEAGRLAPDIKAVIDEARFRLTDNSGQRGLAGMASGDLQPEQVQSIPRRGSDGLSLEALSADARRVAIETGDIEFPAIRSVIDEARGKLDADVEAGRISLEDAQQKYARELMELEVAESLRTSLPEPGMNVPDEMKAQRAFNRMADARYRRDLARQEMQRLANDPPDVVDVADLQDRRAVQQQIIDVLDEEIADLALVEALNRDQILSKRNRKPAQVRASDIAEDGAYIRDLGDRLQAELHQAALDAHDDVFGGERPRASESAAERKARRATGQGRGGEWDALHHESPVWANRRGRTWYIRQKWLSPGGGGLLPDDFAMMVQRRNAAMAGWDVEQIMGAYLDSIDRIYDTRRKPAMNDSIVETVAANLDIDIEMAHAALRGPRVFKSYLRDVANAQALEIKQAFDALPNEQQLRFLADLDDLDTTNLDAAAKADVFYEALEDHFAEGRDSGLELPGERELFEHVVGTFTADDIRTMIDTGQLNEAQLKRAESAKLVAESKRQIADMAVAELDAKIVGARNDAIARRATADAAADPAPRLEQYPPLTPVGRFSDIDTGQGVFDPLNSYIDPDAPALRAAPLEAGIAEQMEFGDRSQVKPLPKPDGDTVGLNATPDGAWEGGTSLEPIRNRNEVLAEGPPIDDTVPPMSPGEAINQAEGRAQQRVADAKEIRDRAQRDLRRAQLKARNLERDLRRSVQDELVGINRRGIDKMRSIARNGSPERLGGYVPATESTRARLTGLTGDMATKHGLYQDVIDAVQRGEGRGGTLDPAAVVLANMLDDRVARGGDGLGLDRGRWTDAVISSELTAALDDLGNADGLMAAWAAYDTVTARLNRIPPNLRGSFGDDFNTLLSDAMNDTRRRFNNKLKVTADTAMSSLPARFRTPIMEARRGVEAYLKQAQKEWDLGNRDVAMALESVVQDFPTSIQMYVDQALPTPTHLIGGDIVVGGRGRRAGDGLAVPDTRQSNKRSTSFRVNTLDEYARIEAHEMAAIARRTGIQHLATDPSLSASAWDIVGDLIEEQLAITPELKLRWGGRDGIDAMLRERGYTIVKGATRETRTRSGFPDTLMFKEAPVVGGIDAGGNQRRTGYLGDGTIIDIDAITNADLPNVRVMPTKLAEALGDFMEPTSNAALLMYDQTQQLWKTATLAWSPAWVTYNAIGNALMANFSYGMGPGRLTSNIRTLREAMRKQNMEIGDGGQRPLIRGFRNDSMSTLVPGELDLHGLSRSEKGLMMRMSGDQTRLGRALDYVGNPDRSRLGKVTEWMYSVNEFTDNLFRSAVFMEDLHKRLVKEAPIPRDLLDANGNLRRNLTPEQTAQLTQVSAAAKRAQDNAVRAALNTMGDFTRMTKFERNYIKRVMPFYPWVRHVTAMTMRMPLTNPMRWAWMASLHNSLNEAGDGEAERGLLAMLMGVPGSNLMASLTPAIPFSPGITPFGNNEDPEFGAFDPRTLLGSVSPLLKFPAEAVTGFDVDGGGTVSRPMDQKTATGSFGETINPSSLSRIVGGVFGGDLGTTRRGLGEFLYNAAGQVSPTRGVRDLALGALEGNKVRYDSGDAIGYLEDRTDTMPMRLGNALRIPFTPRDYEYQLEVARQKDADAARAARRSLARAARGG